MLKKIVLPVVLLIFTQQEFYGTGTIDESPNILKTINDYVNVENIKGNKKYPKLWWLWAIVDNVQFQYGNSKIWKHGEAYYGLSNGIGFFPSILNFGWIKIGIIDAHINVINLISDYFKNFIQCKIDNDETINFLFLPILICLFFNLHIFSIKILNCIKIKLVAPLTLVVTALLGFDIVDVRESDKGTQWYITYNVDKQISWWYPLLSPRIEINISGIINYFRGK